MSAWVCLSRHWENFLLEYLHFLKETYYRRLWNALFHHRQTVLCFVWVEQRERRDAHSRKSGQHQIFSGKNSLLLGNILLNLPLSLSSFCTCWSPRSSSSTFWLLWCLTLTREYRLPDITTTFFNQKTIIFFPATIRHGVEIWQIKIDNVSDILILYFWF